MIRILFTFLFVISLNNVFAQDVAITNPSSYTKFDGARSSQQTLSLNLRPQEGTYQIVYVDANVIPEIPEQILLQINQERKENEIVYIHYCSEAKIRILPYSTIRSNSFIPVAKYVSHEE